MVDGKKMTCHSSNCFNIVWGQGNARLVTSLPSSCDMTQSSYYILLTTILLGRGGNGWEVGPWKRCVLVDREQDFNHTIKMNKTFKLCP